MDRNRQVSPSPWDRPMQDEGDLYASFDVLTWRQKALTLLGLTIAAWALLGTLAAVVWIAFH